MPNALTRIWGIYDTSTVGNNLYRAVRLALSGSPPATSGFMHGEEVDRNAAAGDAPEPIQLMERRNGCSPPAFEGAEDEVARLRVYCGAKAYIGDEKTTTRRVCLRGISAVPD